MFGRNKDEEKKEEVIPPGPTPFEIGKNGTVDELFLANNAALAKSDAPAQKELQRGAIEAFNDGRPGNIQTILSNPDTFKTWSYYPKDRKDPAIEILIALTAEGERSAEIINLALDQLSEERKQQVLDKTLLEVVRGYNYVESFVTALLEAGADVNAAFDGFKGLILARAVEKTQPPAVIELLYKNAASFDDALFVMQANNWNEELVKKLKIYREKMTGQPATEEGEVLQELKLLRQEIAEMRQDLTSRLPAPPKVRTPRSPGEKNSPAP